MKTLVIDRGINYYKLSHDVKILYRIEGLWCRCGLKRTGNVEIHELVNVLGPDK